MNMCATYVAHNVPHILCEFSALHGVPISFLQSICFHHGKPWETHRAFLYSPRARGHLIAKKRQMFSGYF